MNNLFKNAHFGKPYRTRGDRKAIYQRSQNGVHILFTETIKTACESDGRNTSHGHPYDIVSEWKADYDEVRNKAIDSYINSPNIGEDPLKWYTEGYFAGYKEHMEINFD